MELFLETHQDHHYQSVADSIFAGVSSVGFERGVGVGVTRYL